MKTIICKNIFCDYFNNRCVCNCSEQDPEYCFSARIASRFRQCVEENEMRHTAYSNLPKSEQYLIWLFYEQGYRNGLGHSLQPKGFQEGEENVST